MIETSCTTSHAEIPFFPESGSSPSLLSELLYLNHTLLPIYSTLPIRVLPVFSLTPSAASCKPALCYSHAELAARWHQQVGAAATGITFRPRSTGIPDYRHSRTGTEFPNPWYHQITSLVFCFYSTIRRPVQKRLYLFTFFPPRISVVLTSTIAAYLSKLPTAPLHHQHLYQPLKLSISYYGRKVQRGAVWLIPWEHWCLSTCPPVFVITVPAEKGVFS